MKSKFKFCNQTKYINKCKKCFKQRCSEQKVLGGSRSTQNKVHSETGNITKVKRVKNLQYISK